VGRVKVLNNTMKPKFVKYYMEIAELTAKLSYAVRLNVGAVIVKGNQILATGYNGMPSGWENVCERKVFSRFSDINPHTDPITYEYISQEILDEQYPYIEYVGDKPVNRYTLVSKPEVLHAERNCLDKVAASNESTLGATLFVTHSPCLECAKSIYNTGISDVYYKHEYRSNAGIDFLKKTGVKVHKYAEPDL
jgi:dCMP deaminase